MGKTSEVALYLRVPVTVRAAHERTETFLENCSDLKLSSSISRDYAMDDKIKIKILIRHQTIPLFPLLFLKLIM